MKKVGKNKAVAVDEVMDIIYQESEWEKCPLGGYSPWKEHMFPVEEKLEIHRKEVENRLSKNMAMYLNNYLENEDCLPYEQNFLE